MIERFEGVEGRRLFINELLTQTIVLNDSDMASALADASELRELAAGDVLIKQDGEDNDIFFICLLYTSPSRRDRQKSRMPSSA